MSNKTNIDAFESHLRKARKAPATITQYVRVARKYAAFCKGKTFDSPQEAVCAFLSTFKDLSEKSQDVALNALAGRNGLYAALGKPLGKLPQWVKGKAPVFLPVWVTQNETEKIAAHLDETWSLMARLMFGTGLRIGEVVSLRWRDLDFERLTITVKQSKGKKDRITFLPASLVDDFRALYPRVRGLWKEDREAGRPGVQIPRPVANKSPRAGNDWAFFWVFPAAGESKCPETGIVRRHHIHKKSLSRPLRAATRRAGVAKRVTAHSFRHGFATAYLMAGGNIRELRDLLGHQSIQTTEVYLHCLPTFTDRVGSPLDRRANVAPFSPRTAIAATARHA